MENIGIIVQLVVFAQLAQLCSRYAHIPPLLILYIIDFIKLIDILRVVLILQ